MVGKGPPPLGLKRRQVDIFIGIHLAQNDTLGKRERMTEGQNPFLDREAWSTFLDELEHRAREAFGMSNQDKQPTS